LNLDRARSAGRHLQLVSPPAALAVLLLGGIAPPSSEPGPSASSELCARPFPRPVSHPGPAPLLPQPLDSDRWADRYPGRSSICSPAGLPRKPGCALYIRRIPDRSVPASAKVLADAIPVPLPEAIRVSGQELGDWNAPVIRAPSARHARPQIFPPPSASTRPRHPSSRIPKVSITRPVSPDRARVGVDRGHAYWVLWARHWFAQGLRQGWRRISPLAPSAERIPPLGSLQPPPSGRPRPAFSLRKPPIRIHGGVTGCSEASKLSRRTF